MTGLEKMKSQILEEANTAAEEKLAGAKAQAREILESAKVEAKKSVDSIHQKSQADVGNYKERILSSIELQKRMQILSTKQEVIAAVLEKAYTALTEMEDGEYFELLLKLLEKHVLGEEGTIFFSAKDMKRMPAEFVQKVEQAAKEKGGSLTISTEMSSVENGFVLAYGGIEENCTLRAILDEKKDDLSDSIHRLLFV